MRAIIAVALVSFSTHAAAGEIVYKLEGEVDLTTVPTADLKSLGLSPDSSAALSIEMIVDKGAADIAASPTSGTYRVEATQLTIGPIRLRDPGRGAATISKSSQNMIFRVNDGSVTDALGWDYSPMRNGPFGNLNRVTAGLSFDNMILSRDALPIDPALAGQMLQSSLSGPFLTLRTVKNSNFVLPVNNGFLSIITQ